MKVRKVIGLLMMFLPTVLIVIGLWYFERVGYGNTLQNIQQALVMGVPPLILAGAASWRPLLGGSIAFGLSLPVVAFWTLRSIFTYDIEPLWAYANLLLVLIFMVGSILVFTSARRTGGQAVKSPDSGRQL